MRRESAILAEERHRQIVTRVQSSGTVRVATLARELQVTEETIRRDLEKLGNDRKLVRIHGGAMVVENDRRDLPYSVRETEHLAEKRAIARSAGRHIGEGDVIALDASSTAVELAHVIPDIALTVITNSHVISSALVDRTRVRVILTGGILDAPSLSYLGSMSEQALDRFHITKLFFSSQGVDLARGLSVAADEHARIKRRMIDLADRRYLLVDSSKFGRRAVEFFAQLAEVDRLITDAGVDAATLEELREMGVTTEIAEA